MLNKKFFKYSGPIAKISFAAFISIASIAHNAQADVSVRCKTFNVQLNSSTGVMSVRADYGQTISGNTYKFSPDSGNTQYVLMFQNAQNTPDAYYLTVLDTGYIGLNGVDVPGGAECQGPFARSTAGQINYF